MNHESHPPSSGENPYQSPALVESDSSANDFLIDGERRTLVGVKRIARYQRYVLLFATMQIVCLFLVVTAGRDLSWLPAMGIYLAAVLGMVFGILLAIEFFHPVAGVAFGFLALIPCLGLFVLLAISMKATNILRRNGIRVGLFGAAAREFEPRTSDETL